ncbi:hypothetical protein ACWD04_20520 [Streptomyces sp. NPDC002911]
MTNRQHPSPPHVVAVGAGLTGPACALDLDRATGSGRSAQASGSRAAREVLADRASARTPAK